MWCCPQLQGCSQICCIKFSKSGLLSAWAISVLNQTGLNSRTYTLYMSAPPPKKKKNNRKKSCTHKISPSWVTIFQVRITFSMSDLILNQTELNCRTYILQMSTKKKNCTHKISPTWVTLSILVKEQKHDAALIGSLLLSVFVPTIFTCLALTKKIYIVKLSQHFSLKSSTFVLHSVVHVCCTEDSSPLYRPHSWFEGLWMTLRSWNPEEQRWFEYRTNQLADQSETGYQWGRSGHCCTEVEGAVVAEPNLGHKQKMRNHIQLWMKTLANLQILVCVSVEKSFCKYTLALVHIQDLCEEKKNRHNLYLENKLYIQGLCEKSWDNYI